MTRPVPQCALTFLDRVEANKLAAYLDSTGKPTIGRGHTGPEVHLGMTITPAQSDAYLFADATTAATRLALMVKDEVIEALSEHQYAALVSFVFNLGTPKSALWGLLNARNFAAVPAKLLEFDKAHLRGPDKPASVVPGLYNRRMAEVTLWNTADADAAAAVANAVPVAHPSSVTRDVETPEAAPPVKPNIKSKSFVASAVTGVGTVAYAAAQNVQSIGETVKGAIAPFVADSPVLQALNGHIVLVLAGCAVLSTLLIGLKNKGIS